MDNLWTNGWSDEPEIPVLNNAKPIITPTSWEPSTGEEADLSAPSWSSGSDIKWSETPETQGSLWSQTIDPPHLDGWGSSTPKGISLGRLTLEPPSPQEEEKLDSTPFSYVQRTPPIPSSVQEDTTTPPRSPSPVPESPHLPGTPEVFGSFETAPNVEHTKDDDPWSSPISAIPLDTGEVDQWGSAWTAPRANEQESEEIPDEWEVARQRKANMDRQVVSILLIRLELILTSAAASRATCFHPSEMRRGLLCLMDRP